MTGPERKRERIAEKIYIYIDKYIDKFIDVAYTVYRISQYKGEEL